MEEEHWETSKLFQKWKLTLFQEIIASRTNENTNNFVKCKQIQEQRTHQNYLVQNSTYSENQE